jgi:hypothetical protein
MVWSQPIALPGALRHGAASAVRGLINAVLPPQCLACDALVATPGNLCADCWSDTKFITAPHCSVCGVPYSFDPGADAVCGACIRARPLYDRARAVLRYDDLGRRLVVSFKHGDRTHGAPTFGRWLARAGAELIADADLVAPVPLHRLRLMRRRFNQSAMLAQAVCRSATGHGLEFAPDLSSPNGAVGGAAGSAGRRCLYHRRHGVGMRPRLAKGRRRCGRCADRRPRRRAPRRALNRPEYTRI